MRISDHPRYNLEMALLRLMHLRKLVPLSELLSGSGNVSRLQQPPRPAPAQVPNVPKVPVVPKVSAGVRPAPAPTAPTSGTVGTQGTAGTGAADGFKEKFLSELKASKSTFYNLVVACAYRIVVGPWGILFTFLTNQKNGRSQCDEQKAWLQSIAEKVAGRPVPVSIAVADAGAQPSPAPTLPASSAPAQKSSPEELKAEAMANSTVQAVLEIFPVDKTTIEER